MATSNNQSVAKFFQAYGYRNASRVKAESDLFTAQDLDVKRGKENYVFSIGQTVIATGNGQLKAGLQFEIKNRQQVNGYCQYYAGGVWNSQSDLMVQ